MVNIHFYANELTHGSASPSSKRAGPFTIQSDIYTGFRKVQNSSRFENALVGNEFP